MKNIKSINTSDTLKFICCFLILSQIAYVFVEPNLTNHVSEWIIISISIFIGVFVSWKLVKPKIEWTA